MILQEVYDRILQFRYRRKLRHSLFAGIICSIHGSSVRIRNGDWLPEGIGHINDLVRSRLIVDVQFSNNGFIPTVSEQKSLAACFSCVFGYQSNAVSRIIYIPQVVSINVRRSCKAVVNIPEPDAQPVGV